MTEINAIRNPDRCPTHPGALVEDLLETNNLPIAGVAAMIGISRQTLHALIRGNKPVSADVAARLGKLFGNGPGLWLRMQAAYDAWHAEREVDTSNIKTLEHA